MHDCQSPGEPLPCTKWLREHLLWWFEQHGRSFHWREPGRSAYELTVAEILLQRTTAAAAARAFPELVARYPTWGEMAGADLEDLQELSSSGLAAAQRSRGSSDWLLSSRNSEANCRGRGASWSALPGVGPYTASALMSAVYGFHEPLVDVNMARVLGRFFGLQVRSRGVRDACLHALAENLCEASGAFPSTGQCWTVEVLLSGQKPALRGVPLREECRFFKPGLLLNRAEPRRRSQVDIAGRRRKMERGCTVIPFATVMRGVFVSLPEP